MKSDRQKSKRLSKSAIFERLEELLTAEPTRNFNVKDLFRLIPAQNHPTKLLVLDVLGELVREDYVSTDGRGNYRYAVRSQVMEGVFMRKTNGRNAFVPDDGGKSILVMERNSNHALNGDRVKAVMLARRQTHTREAQVIEIVERAEHKFVGRLKVDKGYAFLITESRSLANDIFIPPKNMKGGKDGDKAVVEITEWPADSKSPIGKVVDILGKQGDNNAEMNAILAQYDLPYKYPKKVEEAADRIPTDITPEEIAKREDFRDVTTFTIDPHDAKDFDDALSIRRVDYKGREKERVYEIGVHIADVTHYVKEGDIIDREAEQRATSIYLVDRTIPMLPEKLCNFLCSLRPDEDKLTYSTIFHITEAGEVLDWHLAHCVIHSNRRFAYEEVQYILEENGEASEEDLHTAGDHPKALPKGSAPKGDFAEELIVLNRIAKILRGKRFHSGAIGFDRAEVRFEIDDTGHPVSTYLKIAKDANKLIEEFMLLANRTVATSIANPSKNPPLLDPTSGKLTKFSEKTKKKTQPKVFPYRVHDVPNLEKLENLSDFIGRFGYKIKTEGTKTEVSKSLNTLLEKVKGTKEENVVTLVALKAMMKAHYSIHNIGHYGLMFDYYTHFTSPIRRFPDMMVHRLLTRYAEGGRSVNANKYEELCEHASDMEQLAETAERASIKYKQVEFMGDRLGQYFDGTINSVTEYGFYVELDDNGCEGMVPMRELDDDYYEFDEKNYSLVGRRTHKRYNLGDKVVVRVERANLERRQLDFSLVEDPAATSAAASKEIAVWGSKHNKKKKK